MQCEVVKSLSFISKCSGKPLEGFKQRSDLRLQRLFWESGLEGRGGEAEEGAGAEVMVLGQRWL